MLKLALKQVSYGFEAAVRVIRKTLRLARLQVHGAHMVEQKKRIEFTDFVVRECPMNQNAFAVGNRGRGGNSLNGSIS